MARDNQQVDTLLLDVQFHEASVARFCTTVERFSIRRGKSPQILNTHVVDGTEFVQVQAMDVANVPQPAGQGALVESVHGCSNATAFGMATNYMRSGQ